MKERVCTGEDTGEVAATVGPFARGAYRVAIFAFLSGEEFKMSKISRTKSGYVRRRWGRPSRRAAQAGALPGRATAEARLSPVWAPRPEPPSARAGG